MGPHSCSSSQEGAELTVLLQAAHKRQQDGCPQQGSATQAALCQIMPKHASLCIVALDTATCCCKRIEVEPNAGKESWEV
mmetsp:Transcript_3792/g.11104  ORF Transcript_3792/g.11104 Transcript_3792/m.11104 type:complete len:80 (-) Transcript_3792:131-370(-)